MAAKNIPARGEVYLGPLAIKMQKVTVGFAAANDVQFTSQTTKAVFNAPANSLVLDVLAYTDVAWTTSVTLDVGDAANTNGWLATAKVAPTIAQTDGQTKRTSKATADVYAGGKFYSVATPINVIIGGATPAVGKTTLYIIYAENVAAML